MDAAREHGPARRARLSCGNLAHGFAASGADKPMLRSGARRQHRHRHCVQRHAVGAPADGALPGADPHGRAQCRWRAQVAGGVPAMCDGVTQGRAGMELSLFSRDVIAMSTAISLSHDMFDAVLCLGVCDKIVPGLLIGALSFGHLPVIFVPAGPMPSGIPNKQKAEVRQRYATGPGEPRRTAGCRSRLVPQPRHLHVLRHRQFQPDADGSDGPARCRAAPSFRPARPCATR